MDDGWVDGAYGGCGGTGKGGKGDLQSNKNDKYSIVVYTHYSTVVQYSTVQFSSAQLSTARSYLGRRQEAEALLFCLGRQPHPTNHWSP